MELQQLPAILSARKAVVIGAICVSTGVALTASVLLPQTYEATATLVLNYRGIDPVSGVALPAQMLPGYMTTQIDILRSKAIAVRVVDALHLADVPQLREKFKKAGGEGDLRDWIANRLLKNLKVIPALQSGVLDVSYRDNDSSQAARIANAFTSQYQQVLVELKAQPLQQASGYFNNQVKPLRDELEQAQERLSAYQRDNGLTNLDNRLDTETTRLNELSSQLVAVQGQLMDASSRRGQTESGKPAESPDVLSSPLVQNLRASLAQADARLSALAQRLNPLNPTYQAAKAEADKLRSELRTATRATANGVANNAGILERKESELRESLAAQKARVLELNQRRDQMAVLAREVDSAQKSYDGVMDRYAQTKLEARSNQADVAVLNRAVPPAEPSNPGPAAAAAIAAFLGMILGAGLALLLEIYDRRIRRPRDLAQLPDLPYLGYVPRSIIPQQSPGVAQSH